MYNNEEDFLKNYNPNKYDKLSVTSDILIFSVSDEYQDNYRKLNKKHFSVLLIKRKNYPFKDKWCLPGGFVKIDETTEDAAKRILLKETNLHNVYLEQLYTFDDIKRDPRMRIISTSYMALVDKNKLLDKLPINASWFNISIDENDELIEIILDNGIEKIKYEVYKQLKELTTNSYKYFIKSNPLAFDHALVIATGINRLKNKIEYTDIVFNMMSRYFTLGELQQVYEVILNKKLLDPAFRRIIASKVRKTDKIKTGEGHRPSVLYEYKN